MGVSLDLNGGGGLWHHSPPMARHSGVATWAAILCPYETCFYDIIGLNIFSSHPLVGFCWTWIVSIRDMDEKHSMFLSSSFLSFVFFLFNLKDLKAYQQFEANAKGQKGYKGTKGNFS